MKKKILFGLIILILIIFSYAFVKLSKYEVSLEKCNSVKTDDCWHALAHKTNSREFCYNITEENIREHCLEHIP